MTLPEELRLRPADAADLPRIAALREAGGWSVHDWALHAVLEPPHARCIVAVDGRDDVVGVGSGISYGPIGLVGNMIVDERWRRRGVGAAVLESVLDFLGARGATRLELMATDEGRPLYERYGFASSGTSTIAHIPRRIAGLDSRLELRDAGPDVARELCAYDAPRFGGDRGPLVRRMLGDPERPLVVARREGRIVGYGWIRPDGGRLGPLVADTPGTAVALVGEAFERLPSVESLALNLPPANRAGRQALAEFGADLEPWDGRMARGPQVPRRDDTIFGMVVGALG